MTAAPSSADAGSGAAIGGAGRFGSTASNAPLQGAENSATSVRPPTADSRHISLAIVSGGIAGPSAQPSQNSAVRGSGVTFARSAKRCKRVSQTTPVAPSTFTGRPSQARRGLGKRARRTARVALLPSLIRVIGPSAQSRSGLASSNALCSSASHDPGSARSGVSATLGGAPFRPESGIGAGQAEAHALLAGAELGNGLALALGGAASTTGGASFRGADRCARHAEACIKSTPQPSASSRFNAGFGIAGEGFPAQQPLQSGFVDHARAELLGRVGLGFAHLFTDDQVTGALLDLVVHLTARRANRVVHVLALAREHSGHAK